jgi:hydroxymethylbilane synthase
MLPRGARVGTCSARRTAQLRALRMDLTIVPLRGNVPTRIARVTTGDLDAIVLARAGLVRLGLEQHITEIFTPDHVLPAPGQGALAIQCRAEDAPIIARVAALDDAETRRAVLAERTVLHALRGGCSVPVGALAHRTANGLTLAAGVFSLDGLSAVRAQVSGSDPEPLGAQAARRLVALGAEPILAAFDKQVRLEMSVTTGGRS